MLTRDFDFYCECARDYNISACAAGNERICSESARHETDWLTYTDPGRSIGASLILLFVHCKTDKK